PFNGAEYEYRVLCFMHSESLQETEETTKAIEAYIKTLPADLLPQDARKDLTFGGFTASKNEEPVRVKLDPQVPEQALAIAENIGKVQKGLVMPARNAPADKLDNFRRAEARLEEAAAQLRRSAVPRKAAMRLGLWAPCSDRAANEPLGVDGGRIRHADRRAFA